MLFNRDLKTRPIDKKLKLTEKLFLLVCSLLATYVIYAYNMDRYNLSSSDSAGFVDLIRAVAHGEGMVSQVFTSLFAVLPLLVADTIHYCASTLQNVFDCLFFQAIRFNFRYVTIEISCDSECSESCFGAECSLFIFTIFVCQSRIKYSVRTRDYRFSTVGGRFKRAVLFR
jgi:hypothetical protein